MAQGLSLKEKRFCWVRDGTAGTGTVVMYVVSGIRLGNPDPSRNLGVQGWGRWLLGKVMSQMVCVPRGLFQKVVSLMLVVKSLEKVAHRVCKVSFVSPNGLLLFFLLCQGTRVGETV